MKPLFFCSSLLCMGVSLSPTAMALADGGDPSMQKQERNNGVVLAQFATPQYEIYQNGRFNFQVKYPTDILTPLSPPTNNDGRVFVSPTRDIRMVVYGRHQIDQSLEAYYQSQLQSANLRGAEVTYTYQDDDEYVISGYEPSGEVFYRRTLLRNEDFLVLGFSYDRALQTEFDTVVAEIANSFQTSPELLINGSTKEHQPYEPPSNGSASFFRQRKYVKGTIEISTPECQDLRYALRFPSSACDLNAFINLLDPRFD